MLTEVTVKGQVHYGEVLLQHNALRGHNQDRKWKWCHFLTFQTLVDTEEKNNTIYFDCPEFYGRFIYEETSA